jgi:NAD(P)-dependent dehydrogenase (short-subunit alcohol dehydrogenase family)
MKVLAERVAFVTGGASGIGLGIVRGFLDAGMKVVAADIRQDHLDAAAAALSASRDVAFLQLDVTDRAAMVSARAYTEERFGKVHVLCNNAGVGIVAGARDATYDDWDWSMSVNLTSVFNGIHCFLPALLSHGEGGHIVNTASIAACLPGNIVYAAAKCGVMGLSEGLRAELSSDNIGVTCLLPGPTASNIHEVARLRPSRFSNTNLGDFEQELATRSPSPEWLDPLLVGDLVVDAVRRNLLFVFTHNEHRAGVTRRFEAILAAFPSGEVVPGGAQRLGFRIANPMYDELLAAAEPPAKHRRSQA